ncbi:MAG: hypothetical protein R3D99_07915 [Altererythrobacter sp.]
MVPGVEGGFTSYNGEQMAIYDAAMKHKADGTPLVVIGGKEYGTGSSRDWAAKGTILLGVRAVIVESFERIHRSNSSAWVCCRSSSRKAIRARRWRFRATTASASRGWPISSRARMSKSLSPAPTARSSASPHAAASIRRTRWNTTATAVSSTTCCASWPPDRINRVPTPAIGVAGVGIFI